MANGPHRSVSQKKTVRLDGDTRTPHAVKAPAPEEPLPSISPLQAAMYKPRTASGDALHIRHHAIGEPVFGQIKTCGCDRLSLRRVAKARGEWALIALTHNLLKLHKARRGRAATPGPGRW